MRCTKNYSPRENYTVVSSLSTSSVHDKHVPILRSRLCTIIEVLRKEIRYRGPRDINIIQCKSSIDLSCLFISYTLLSKSSLFRERDGTIKIETRKKERERERGEGRERERKKRTLLIKAIVFQRFYDIIAYLLFNRTFVPI